MMAKPVKSSQFMIPLKPREQDVSSCSRREPRPVPPVLSRTEIHRNFSRWRFGDHGVPAREVARKENRGSDTFRRVIHDLDRDRDDPVRARVPRAHPRDNYVRPEYLSLEQRRWLGQMPSGWRRPT